MKLLDPDDEKIYNRMAELDGKMEFADACILVGRELHRNPFDVARIWREQVDE